jgi:hypothetical protein
MPWRSPSSIFVALPTRNAGGWNRSTWSDMLNAIKSGAVNLKDYDLSASGTSRSVPSLYRMPYGRLQEDFRPAHRECYGSIPRAAAYLPAATTKIS